VECGLDNGREKFWWSMCLIVLFSSVAGSCSGPRGVEEPSGGELMIVVVEMGMRMEKIMGRDICSNKSAAAFCLLCAMTFGFGSSARLQ